VKKLRLALILAMVAGLLSLVPCKRWQGLFPEAEFKLLVVDRAGRPVEGAELSVRDSRHVPSDNYPIDEFSRDTPVRSDKNGIIRVHHRIKRGEFGGECRHFFFVIPVGTCSAPKFDIIIKKNGSSFQTDFAELYNLVPPNEDGQYFIERKVTL
jgi:hypothetical protein